jgi:hypothetical protein
MVILDEDVHLEVDGRGKLGKHLRVKGIIPAPPAAAAVTP